LPVNRTLGGQAGTAIATLLHRDIDVCRGYAARTGRGVATQARLGERARAGTVISKDLATGVSAMGVVHPEGRMLGILLLWRSKHRAPN
jgi:hypothetical protein